MRTWFCVDVLIVGAGMAGISAALWGQRLGLSCAVLEQSTRIGGQLHKVYNVIPDYPGILCDGPGLIERLREQCQTLQIVPTCGVSVERVWSEQESRVWAEQTEQDAGKYRYVECSEERGVGCRAMVVATGLQAKVWDVSGAQIWTGRGVFYTFSGQKEAFVGKRVCVVGGGDGAFENALMMAEVCPSVTIVYRGPKPRARLDFQERVASHPRIDLRLGCDILSVGGQQQMEAVVIRDREGEHVLRVDAVLVKIGMEPQARWLQGVCERDKDGYVWVDREQRTSARWIWAVGDVCTPRDPSLVVAAGQACVALRGIERTLSLRKNGE